MALEAWANHISTLFEITLSGGYRGDRPWQAVVELRRHGNRFVFDTASNWSHSTNPFKRARAADILGQLRRSPLSSTQIYTSEAFALVSKMLASERHERALESEIYSLGHIGLADAVPLLLPFRKSSSKDIRLATTHALGQFPQDWPAIDALINLSKDHDKQIRNWATFAFGTQSDLDFPELRSALVERLDDSFRDVKEEAIAGLAKRKDQRALQPLRKLLSSGSYFTHHEFEYESFVEAERPQEGWTAGTLLTALDRRFLSDAGRKH